MNDRRRSTFSLSTLLLAVLIAALILSQFVMVNQLLGFPEAGATLWIWLMYAIIASVLSAPIVFLGRKRVHWRFWEILVLIFPFMAWNLLMFSELSFGKSLANLGEPFFFAFAVPIAAAVRVAIGSRVQEGVCSAILIAAVCLIAVGVFFVVPSLPE